MTGNELLNWYVESSHVATTLAANLLAQSTLIVGAGLVAARAFRKRGVAVQSAILRGTLLAVLFCPLASWLLGASGVSGLGFALPKASGTDGDFNAFVEREGAGEGHALRSADGTTDSLTDARGPEGRFRAALGTGGRSGEGSLSSSGRSPEERAAGTLASTANEASAQGVSPLRSPSGQLGVLAMVYGGLTAVWLAVASALAIRLGVAHLRMWTACRGARPASEGLRAECRALARALRLRPPRLLVSCRISNPCLMGWWRPAILLPSNGRPIGRDVLVHELAHLARRDCLWHFAGRLAASVFFFQPLLWVLTRRLVQVAEEVCDDHVVVHSADRASYARQLVDIAEQLHLGWPAQTAGVGVVSFKSSLSRRVGRILDTSRCLSIRAGGRALSAIAVLGLCATMLVGLIGAEGTGAAAGITEQAAASEVETSASGSNEGSGAEQVADVSAASAGQRIVLRGRVLGPDGQPFAGASLYVQTSYDWNVLREHPVRATTGEDGAYQFEVAKSELDPLGEEVFSRYILIIAAAKGHGPDWGNGLEEGGTTLRLVEDATIQGRLVDSDGGPAEGATVRVTEIQTTPQEDLGAWVEALKTAREARAVENRFLRKSAPLSLLGSAFPPLTTGPDGRFVLSGIGKERMATLRIEGPAIETSIINVMTRPAERVELRDYRGSPAWRTVYYGATFEHPVARAKAIVGVVRDKDTGEPLAGVTLRGAGSLGGSSLVQYVETSSDAEGKYRLTGLPKRDDCAVVAIPSRDQPYLLSRLPVKEDPEAEEITLDFELKRGIWIEGTVTDKATGEPVKAGVFYFVFTDNPHYKEAPGLNGAMLGWIDSYYIAPEGSFRVVGLPGRGLIAVRVPGNEAYRMGIGASRIKEGWSGDGRDMLRTAPYICLATNFNTLAEINPTEDQASYQCNLTVDPGRVLRGEVRDPDGNPLAGAFVNGGRSEYRTWAHFPLETATFTVRAYNPAKPRRLLFVHKERQLAGSVAVEGDDPGQLTVRLEPWAVITGRVVDEKGAPKGGVRLISWRGLEPEPESQVPTTGALFPQEVYAEDDGRFRIEGLVPGLIYGIAVLERPSEAGAPRFTGRIASDLILKPGETKDLGDVQPKQPSDPR